MMAMSGWLSGWKGESSEAERFYVCASLHCTARMSLAWSPCSNERQPRLDHSDPTVTDENADYNCSEGRSQK